MSEPRLCPFCKGWTFQYEQETHWLCQLCGKEIQKEKNNEKI